MLLEIVLLVNNPPSHGQRLCLYMFVLNKVGSTLAWCVWFKLSTGMARIQSPRWILFTVYSLNCIHSQYCIVIFDLPRGSVYVWQVMHIRVKALWLECHSTHLKLRRCCFYCFIFTLVTLFVFDSCDKKYYQERLVKTIYLFVIDDSIQCISVWMTH